MNKSIVIMFSLIFTLVSHLANAERIKDIASIAGVRTNQLIGYGLVVGLDGTGDQTTQTPFTTQSLISMLNQFGVSIPAGTNLQLKNIASVSLHAELPPFAKPGQKIDVTISSIGNAKSLRGGSLLMAPLRGADGEIYAVAQGNLVVSGFGGAGEDGSKITVNVPSVGRVPNGATVERGIPNNFATSEALYFNLNNPDFTTAHRMADAINSMVGEGMASAMDGSTVRVRAPIGTPERIAYVSLLENLTLEPGNAAAKVIINSRTGTVVIGQNVRVSPAAVTHGNLTVTIGEDLAVSQPQPLAAGETVVTTSSEVEIAQETNRMFLFEHSVSLGDIVQSINEVGAAPGDLVAILEALREVGALRAQLIVL